MTIGTGIGRRIAFKEESTPGTFAGASGAQVLRRVTCGLNMTKAELQSQELRDDYQIATSRHGMRRIEGPFEGELSFGTYQSFFEAAMRKAAAAVSNITGLTLTVAASGSNYTVTRGAGSWISDGVRIGMVVRVTAGLAAGSLSKNLLVVALTATVMTVYVLNGYTLTAEGPLGSCTVTVPGKHIIVPSSGHIDRAYSIEDLQNDLSPVISKTFLGVRVASMAISLQPGGLAKVNMNFLGVDMLLDDAEAFSSPTSAGTSAAAAAVSGALLLDGVVYPVVTGFNFTINGGHSVGEVVGSDITPDVFEGPVLVDGQLSAYLQDNTLLAAFDAETEARLSVTLLAGSEGNCEFVQFSFPRIKVNGASNDDGPKAVVQTVPVRMLKKETATGYDSTTLMVQDSTFV